MGTRDHFQQMLVGYSMLFTLEGALVWNIYAEWLPEPNHAPSPSCEKWRLDLLVRKPGQGFQPSTWTASWPKDCGEGVGPGKQLLRTSAATLESIAGPAGPRALPEFAEGRVHEGELLLARREGRGRALVE